MCVFQRDFCFDFWHFDNRIRGNEGIHPIPDYFSYIFQSQISCFVFCLWLVRFTLSKHTRYFILKCQNIGLNSLCICYLLMRTEFYIWLSFRYLMNFKLFDFSHFYLLFNCQLFFFLLDNLLFFKVVRDAKELRTERWNSMTDESNRKAQKLEHWIQSRWVFGFSIRLYMCRCRYSITIQTHVPRLCWTLHPKYSIRYVYHKSRCCHKHMMLSRCLREKLFALCARVGKSNKEANLWMTL